MCIENGRWAYVEVVCIATTTDDLVQTFCCSKTCWTSADDEDIDFSGDSVSEFLASMGNDRLHDGRNDMAKLKMDGMKFKEIVHSRMRGHHHLDEIHLQRQE